MIIPHIIIISRLSFARHENGFIRTWKDDNIERFDKICFIELIRVEDGKWYLVCIKYVAGPSCIHIMKIGFDQSNPGNRKRNCFEFPLLFNKSGREFQLF